MNCNSAKQNYIPMQPISPGLGCIADTQNNTAMQFSNWNNTFPVNPSQPPSQIPAMQLGPAAAPATVEQMPAPAVAATPLPPATRETLAESIYIPGYLHNNIGALMRVEFLIGGNMADRVGVLREVGANFIVLDSLDGNSKMMCDMLSIKFVTILQSSIDRGLLGNFLNT